MLPSEHPLANKVLSGLQATEYTAASWLVGVCLFAPDATSQSLITPSVPLLANVLPSGAKTIPRMSVCEPFQSRSPQPRSHNVTVPSQLPVARVRSSGLKAQR